MIAVNQSVTVPFGEFAGCVRTADFTRLEPDQLEHKVYCPGVGLVSEGSADGEESNELVDVETP